MSNAYVWKDEAVLVIGHEIWTDDASNYGILSCPMVDTNCKGIYERYGHFTEGFDDTASFDVAWRHIPLEKFPKEFRMHLLLLNIH